MARSAILNVMIQAAIKAGRSLGRDYLDSKNQQFTFKGPADYVSAADKKSEAIIKASLEAAKPNYGYLMEESGETIGSDSQHRFIVDPLDGTTNFLHGIHLFCVSIALESQGKIVAAVIYNPILDELFTAELGKGAFLNDRRIRVSNIKNPEDYVICTGIPHVGKRGHGIFLHELAHIMPDVAGIRRTGAAALDLAYVAAGRFDGFWEDNLKIWDMAAGILLIKEAGGFVTDKLGSNQIFKTQNIVAGGEYSHKYILQQLKQANAARNK